MSETIYGIHAVKAFVSNHPERLIEVLALKGRDDQRLQPLINEIQRLGISVQFLNRQTLDKKAEGEVHQGIIARVHPLPELNENDLDRLLETHNAPLLLVLDGVTDPHNLGACLRTADAAGVSAVIVPKDKSAQLNSTARKVACGAAENVPLIRVTNRDTMCGLLAPPVKPAKPSIKPSSPAPWHWSWGQKAKACAA